MSTNCAIIAVIFSVLFGYGYCIKCFTCNSAIYPKCQELKANDTNSPFLTECQEDIYRTKLFCRKTVYKNIAGDLERTVRGCGFIVNETEWGKDSCKKHDANFIKTMSCQCFSDGCNTAQSFLVSNFNYTLLIFSLFTTICLNLKEYIS